LTIKKAEQTPQARVFISCGQRTEEEKGLGSSCKKHFERRGFSVYLAEAVQSLEALTENIFNHLRNSEYAVFIDCARGEVSPGEFIRGSVFVNQELAIAAFLGIVSRVFHEEGVTREGVAEYLIAKPVLFKSRPQFLGKLRRQTKEWRSDWRNELFLDFYRVVPDIGLQDGRSADWYHLKVVNNHLNTYARNCVAYISRIEYSDTGQEINVGNFELVWAGTGLFERHILPKRQAEIDAFLIIRGENVIRFNHRPSTSTEYGMPLLEKGNYFITYLLVSENFEQVIRTFKLEFGGDFQHVKFSAVK
jgi:hypothetical protein